MPTTPLVPESGDWPEVESNVYRAGWSIPLVVGAGFLLIGTFGFLTVGADQPPGRPQWPAKTFMAFFALAGAATLTLACYLRLARVLIRHAAPGVLPDLSSEPVLYGQADVHMSVEFEWSESPDDASPAPARRPPVEQAWLLGLGIPFLVALAAFLSRDLLGKLPLGGWPLAIGLGSLLTFGIGGATLLMIVWSSRSRWRHICRLSILRSGTQVELSWPPQFSCIESSLSAGMEFLPGEHRQHRLEIPRDQLVAVQLSPWQIRQDATTTWAVQGQLVLRGTDETPYTRLPLFLTHDVITAAHRLQQLAKTLRIPYLFHAHQTGWKAEMEAAKTRPPIGH